jgi:hypothetical protein
MLHISNALHTPESVQQSVININRVRINGPSKEIFGRMC